MGLRSRIVPIVSACAISLALLAPAVFAQGKKDMMGKDEMMTKDGMMAKDKMKKEEMKEDMMAKKKGDMPMKKDEMKK